MNMQILIAALHLGVPIPDTLFADGFEGGGSNPFLGPPVVIDWGTLPAGCQTLYPLQIRNDTDVDRSTSVARSALPMAFDLGLASLDDLVVAGPGFRRVPAQFSVAARWSAGPDDSAAPLRWVVGDVLSNVPAQSMARYLLMHCPGQSPISMSETQVTVAPGMNGDFIVDTDSVQFTVAGMSNGMPLRRADGSSWSVNLDGSMTLAAAGQGAVTAPAAALEWIETGPVRAVARLRGNFPVAGCGSDPGYDVRYEFSLGSAEVLVAHDFVNECGPGTSAIGLGTSPINGSPWFDDVLSDATVRLTVVPDSSGAPEGTTDGSAVISDTNGLRVAQLPGIDQIPSMDAEWRRAVVLGGPGFGTISDAADFWKRPAVGLRSAEWHIGASIGWMRYREPQAIESVPGALSLVLVDDETVGEAQGLWNRAFLSFGASNQSLDDVTRLAHAETERPLLLHVPTPSLNLAQVFPPLTSDVNDARWDLWTGLVDQVHDDTIRTDGQWDRQKSFGLTAWPDVVAAGLFEFSSNPSLDDFVPGTNIWSPTNTELLMWYSTGDPKWVWDFAMPQEWTQLKTNYYNTGSRGTVGSRNGFVVVDSSVGPDGLRYRSGFGSDDKTYNQGSGKAYLIYPDVSIRDRFAAAGDTYISRYVDALPRDAGLAGRVIRRGPMQHLNMLRYAAEFAPVNDDRFLIKLNNVMNELAADNLFAGVPCEADDGVVNQDDCAVTAAGFFHHASLWQEMFWQMQQNFFGTPWAATVDQTLRDTAFLVENLVIPRDMSNSATFDPGLWGNSFECDFSGSSDPVTDCIPYTCTGFLSPGPGQNCFDVGRDPFYSNAFLPTLATAIMGYYREGVLGLVECQRLAADLSTLMGEAGFRNYFERGAGWFKDVNQLSQLGPYAIAIADICEGQSAP